MAHSSTSSLGAKLICLVSRICGFCLRSAVDWYQVDALLANGHRDILGYVGDQYWDVLSSLGHPKPPRATDAIGVALYGDEIQVWDGVQMMCLCWMSESSPFLKDPPKSRFLIGCIPCSAYYKENGINWTLQTMLQHVTRSFNTWHSEGVHDLHCEVVQLKGDWKFIKEALNLCKHYGSKDTLCYRCEATRSMVAPFTDITDEAEWRSQVPTVPWDVVPSLLQIHNFSLMSAGIDLLHSWHLGLGRDLISSTMVVLLRSHIFRGRNVAW